MKIKNEIKMNPPALKLRWTMKIKILFAVATVCSLIISGCANNRQRDSNGMDGTGTGYGSSQQGDTNLRKRQQDTTMRRGMDTTRGNRMNDSMPPM